MPNAVHTERSLSSEIEIRIEKLKNTQNLATYQIVHFNSLRNSKRHNKGNFKSKSNSNEIKLCGGVGATLSCFNKISTL